MMLAGFLLHSMATQGIPEFMARLMGFVGIPAFVIENVGVPPSHKDIFNKIQICSPAILHAKGYVHL